MRVPLLNMKHKGSLIMVLGIFFIIAAVAVGFYLGRLATTSNTKQIIPAESNTQVSGKTYTNATQGYSFTYPIEKEVIDCGYGVVVVVEKVRQFEPCGTDRGGFMSISVEDGTVSKLTDGFYENYAISTREFSIDGRSAYRFTGSLLSSDNLAPIPATIDIVQVGIKNRILFIHSVDENILPTIKFLN